MQPPKNVTASWGKNGLTVAWTNPDPEAEWFQIRVRRRSINEPWTVWGGYKKPPAERLGPGWFSIFLNVPLSEGCQSARRTKDTYDICVVACRGTERVWSEIVTAASIYGEPAQELPPPMIPVTGLSTNRMDIVSADGLGLMLLAAPDGRQVYACSQVYTNEWGAVAVVDQKKLLSEPPTAHQKMGHPVDMFVYAGCLYVWCNGSQLLMIYSLADPRRPVLVDILNTTWGIGEGPERCVRFNIFDGALEVDVTHDSGTVLRYSFAHPLNPRVVEEWRK